MRDMPFRAIGFPAPLAVTPMAAPASGGATVTITHRGFMASRAMLAYFNNSGDTISQSAQPNWQSASSFTVTTPPWTIIGPALFDQISVGYTAEAQIVRPVSWQLFRMYVEPDVTQVLPRSGPAQGGTRITLRGNTVHSQVWMTPRCCMGGNPIPGAAGVATYVPDPLPATTGRYECTTGPLPANVATYAAARVSLAYNGVTCPLVAGPLPGAPFTYYNETLMQFAVSTPLSAPVAGGTLLRLNLPSLATSYIDVGDTPVFRLVENVAPAFPAIPLSDVSGARPGTPLLTPDVSGRYTVPSESHTVRVRWAPNGVNFVDAGTMILYGAVEILGTNPAGAPLTGTSAPVVISGIGFAATGEARARFTFPGAGGLSVVVPAAYDADEDRFSVIAPRFTEGNTSFAGNAELSIALNGVDFPATTVHKFPYFRVDEVRPSSGPLEGGTLVTVAGDGFILAGPDLTCRFAGATVAPAVFLSATAITCATPPRAVVGPVSIDVTTNGKDYSSTPITRAAFHYYVNPTISAVSPLSAPTVPSASMVLTVHGTGFPFTSTSAAALPTLRDTPTCLFASIAVAGAWQTETTVICAPPPAPGQLFLTLSPNGRSPAAAGRVLFTYHQLASLAPAIAPAALASRIVLTGTGYVQGVKHYCRLGTTAKGYVEVPAEYVSPVSLVCIVRPKFGVGIIEVYVGTPGGGVGAVQAKTLELHGAAIVNTVVPGSGTSAGGTRIVLNATVADGLLPAGAAPACVIASRAVPATLIENAGSTMTFACTTPGGVGSSSVELALNGRDSERGLARFVYAAVDSVSPAQLPVVGGTVVTVSGNGFEFASLRGDKVVCDIGGIEVPSTVVDDLTLLCSGAPSAATVASSTTAGTTAAGSTVLLRVSVNGRLDYSTAPPLSYYEHPVVSAFSPPMGPTDGGTVVTLYGSRLRAGLATSTAAAGSGSTTAAAATAAAAAAATEACRIGDRQGVYKVDPAGSDFVAYCTAPRGAGAVPVRVSLNAADYVDAAQPGVAAAAAASRFAYYSVISVSPKLGPIAGGTAIEISGSGFTTGPGRALRCRIGTRIATATFVSEAKLICVVPVITRRSQADGAASQHHQDLGGHREGSAALRARELLAAVAVEVDIGAVGWTASQSAAGRFAFYQSVAVDSFFPRQGPAAGGQRVVVTGTNFFNVTTEGLSARFGSRVVPAVYMSATAIACTTPAVVESVLVLSVSFNGGRDWLTAGGVTVDAAEAAIAAATSAAAAQGGDGDASATTAANALPPSAYRFVSCPVGQFASVFTDACAPCPAGTFNDEVGSTSCKRCKDTEYADAEGSTACKPCPSATSVPLGREPDSLQACQCISGHFDPDGRTGRECIACPAGASCAGGGVAPVPAPGFWTSADEPMTFLDCRGMGSQGCIGQGPGVCAFPYRGRLCGDCEDGYYASGSACSKCTALAPLLLFVFLLLCVLLVAMVVLMNSGATGGRLGGAVAIIISTMQMIAIIGELPVGWDERILSALDLISLPFTMSINAAMVECSIPGFSYRSRYLAQIALPVFFATLFALAWLVMRVHHTVFRRNAHLRRSERVLTRWEKFTIPVDMRVAKDRLVASALMLFNLTYMFLVRGALRHFDCTLKADGVWSLDSFPSRSCYESWWWQLLPIAIVASLFYSLLVPVTVIIYMRRNRGRMRVPRFARRFGSFYRTYSPEHALREGYNFTEKCTIAAVAVFLNSYVAFQLAAILAILSLALVSHETTRPFANDRDNHLSTAMRWIVLSFTSLAVLVLAGDPPSSAYFTGFVLLFFTLIGTIGLLASAVVLDDALSRRVAGGTEAARRAEVYLAKVAHPQAFSLVMRYIGSGGGGEGADVALLRALRRCARCAADPALAVGAGSGKEGVLPHTSREDEARLVAFVDNMLHRVLAPAVVPRVARWLVVTAPGLLDRLADAEAFAEQAEANAIIESARAKAAAQAKLAARESFAAGGLSAVLAARKSAAVVDPDDDPEVKAAIKASRRLARERRRRRGVGLARTGAASRFEPPTDPEMIDALCLVGFALAFERHMVRTRTTTWFSYLRRDHARRIVPVTGAALGRPVAWDPRKIHRHGDPLRDDDADDYPDGDDDDDDADGGADGEADGEGDGAGVVGSGKGNGIATTGNHRGHNDARGSSTAAPAQNNAGASKEGLDVVEEVAFLFETLYGYGPLACGRLAETVSRGRLKVIAGGTDPGSGGMPTPDAARGPMHSMSRLHMITTPDPASREFSLRAIRTILGGEVREGLDEEVERILDEIERWREARSAVADGDGDQAYGGDQQPPDDDNENGSGSAKYHARGSASTAPGLEPADAWVTAASGKSSADTAPPPLHPATALQQQQQQQRRAKPSLHASNNNESDDFASAKSGARSSDAFYSDDDYGGSSW
jgi:hypothetical protein